MSCGAGGSFLLRRDSGLPMEDGDEWLWGSGGIGQATQSHHPAPEDAWVVSFEKTDLSTHDHEGPFGRWITARLTLLELERLAGDRLLGPADAERR